MIYLADCVIQLLNNQGLIPGPANTRRHVTISFGFSSDYKNREDLGGGSLVLSSCDWLSLNNYWMGLSKILWFVSGKQINYLRHTRARIERNTICRKTYFDRTTHERTIICRPLFAGHVVGSRPMKRKKMMDRMIILFYKDTVDGILVHKLFVVNLVCPCVGRYLTKV